MMSNKPEKIYSEYLRETFYYVTHKSGLRILLVPKKFSSFYALLGVGYGSVDSSFMCEGETDFTRVPDGIAHYLEHKMFECEEGTDAFAVFSKLGANANAFTTNNLTAYLFSCTSNFEENLSELIRFVCEPYFTEENVEKERGIISEEIEMYEDDPYSALHYGMLGLLYHNHPVKINVAGTVESVREITAEHLYRCYSAFYRPENMILAVSGDTDIDAILGVCDELLTDNEVLSVTRADINEPIRVRQSRATEYRPVCRPLFCIGIKDEVIADPIERARRTVAASIVVDSLFGPSSEFFSELYSDGRINSMSCGYDSMLNYAFSYLIGECEDPESVYSAFRECADKTAREGLSRADFERIKKVSLANFVKNFDSTESVATEGLYLAVDGVMPHEYARLIFEADYGYAAEICKELFSESRCAMMSVLPQRKDDEK